MSLPRDFLAWPRKDRRAWLRQHPEATRDYVRAMIARLSPDELTALKVAATSDSLPIQ